MNQRLHLICVLVMILLVVTACKEEKATPPKAPPPGVLVSKVELRDIVQSQEYIGRTVAINDVHLQAQVSGYLLETKFLEGADVARGDELFIIDPSMYQANVAAAKGELAKAEANLVRAKKDLARYKKLLRSKNISQQQVDVTESEVLQAKAQVTYAKAGLQKANLELSYTQVKAPIDGRIGRAIVSVGNIIGPQTEKLARIVELDPIYVNFSVAERDLMRVKQRRLKNNKSDLQASDIPLEISLILPDGSEYPITGQIDFVDNAVDPATGTVLIRARFSNPDKLLVPGIYVRTVLSREKKQKQLMLHASAVQEDQAGRFVMLVGPDKKVELHRVKTGKQIGGDLVVLEGLEPDQMVIVEGIQKVRPGMLVEPKMATLPGSEKKAAKSEETKRKAVENKEGDSSKPKQSEDKSNNKSATEQNSSTQERS